MDDHGGGWCPDWLKPDWKVIEGAPRAFFGSLIVISVLLGLGMYSLLKVNLDLKTDHISELTSSNASLREENDKLNNEIAKMKSTETAISKVSEDVKQYPDLINPPLIQPEVFSRRTFTNEQIIIDGKSFDHCEFVNVTLKFHGTAPVTFLESKFSGSQTRLSTDNWAIKTYMGLMTEIQKLQTFNTMYIGDLDESGKIQVRSEMRRFKEKKEQTKTNE